MICKKCGKNKEEVYFTDQNGLSNVCVDCKPKREVKVAEVVKVSDKPLIVKTTKKN